MGIGAVLEPLAVVSLLVGGTWINRETYQRSTYSRTASWDSSISTDDSPDPILDVGANDPDSKARLIAGRSRDGSVSPSLLPQLEGRWRTRELRLFSWKRELKTPNTAVFRNRLLSRLLRRFPFLVECWYWALVYWTYQLGRAFTAVTLKDDTVDVAREHALSLIKWEEKLHIFWEVPIQKAFIRHPLLMTYTNWLYSFIHIPGTIAFLVWLYYYTTTRNRADSLHMRLGGGDGATGSPAGPALYEARRRTMAVCNLLAFVVFTLWPCMPPRLLSDESVEGPIGKLARSYGFVDTVHGASGASSVWTQNRFCNQYAAMPSLHFGYALMIGLTIMTIPLRGQRHGSPSIMLGILDGSSAGVRPRAWLPSWRRVACLVIGFLYPFSILAAIVATANHFILDAVAGAIVCGLGWFNNSVLLNLLPIEDYFLWALRIHKPEKSASKRDWCSYDDSEDEGTVIHYPA